MNAHPAGSYFIRVDREPTPPNSNVSRGSWVARDANGHWRNFCNTSLAKTAAEALVIMYHVHVVGTIKDRGETASARIVN